MVNKQNTVPLKDRVQQPMSHRRWFCCLASFPGAMPYTLRETLQQHLAVVWLVGCPRNDRLYHNSDVAKLSHPWKREYKESNRAFLIAIHFSLTGEATEACLEQGWSGTLTFLCLFFYVTVVSRRLWVWPDRLYYHDVCFFRSRWSISRKVRHRQRGLAGGTSCPTEFESKRPW